MSRIVVRRSALDSAWDTALAEFPPELHPAIRRYHKARSDFLQAKRELESAKSGIYWWRIDKALGGL